MRAEREATADIEVIDRRKPGRPKKVRGPGRPKKVKPKPRIRVRVLNSGGRGRGRPKKATAAPIIIDLEEEEQESVESNKDVALEEMINATAKKATAPIIIDLEEEEQESVESNKDVALEEMINATAADAQQARASASDSRDEAFKQREEDAVKEVGILRGQLQQVREEELTALEETCSSQTVHISVLEAQLADAEETCSSQREQISELERQLAAANQKLKTADSSYEDQTRTVADLQRRLLEGDKFRKKMHNTILELKGNIRVFCRVRPPLDDGPGAEPTVSYPSHSMEIAGRGIDFIQNGQKHSFTFDKVFDHGATQKDVFVEVSELVQSALDGYKVCIFAYGQTGAGKTYTMMGTDKAPGLIPTSLEEIFKTSQELASHRWKYKMQASMLEIYNENIQDLLASKSNAGKGGGKEQDYKISHDAKGNTTVADLTIVDVSTKEQVYNLLQKAEKVRSVGSTNMNEESSRSHFVFTLRICGVNESTGQQVQGVLNLIDLAGSERLSRSGATGERLKETQAINKSLSALSDVIFALAKKDEHVPFRNSKLTYLLQPCLSGESKTLMILSVSADPSSIGESLCSLRFAQRVSNVDFGPARNRGRRERREVNDEQSAKQRSKSVPYRSPRFVDSGPRGPAGDFSFVSKKKRKVEFRLD